MSETPMTPPDEPTPEDCTTNGTPVTYTGLMMVCEGSGTPWRGWATCLSMTDEPTPDPMEGESLVNYAATVIKLQRELAALLARLATAEGALNEIAVTGMNHDCNCAGCVCTRIAREALARTAREDS